MTPLRLSVLFLILVLFMPVSVSANGLEASFAGQQTVDGENAVAVTFSMPLDSKQDLSSFLSLRTEDGERVEGAWILAEDPQVVYFAHIEPDTAYRIRIDRGLKAQTGEMLGTEVTYEVSTRPAEPMIAFGSRGFILASKLIRGLPVDSLNISRADIDFFRVKPGMAAEFRKTSGPAILCITTRAGVLPRLPIWSIPAAGTWISKRIYGPR